MSIAPKRRWQCRANGCSRALAQGVLDNGVDETAAPNVITLRRVGALGDWACAPVSASRYLPLAQRKGPSRAGRGIDCL